MSDAGESRPALQPLAGGRLLAEITNRIVALIREHYGRGPIKAKTYVLDNLIVCVLSDGFTPIEQTMMEGGESERVLEMRRDFQRLMKTRYSQMVEELTAANCSPSSGRSTSSPISPSRCSSWMGRCKALAHSSSSSPRTTSRQDSYPGSHPGAPAGEALRRSSPESGSAGSYTSHQIRQIVLAFPLDWVGSLTTGRTGHPPHARVPD